MVEQVTIALTKGRIEKETLALLEKAGFDMSFMMEKGRNLIFESPDGQFRFLLVKAPDVTTYVRHGVADLGIVGKDVLIEHPTGFLEMLDLNFGLCKFSVASIPTYNPSDHKRKRIATKYPTVAMEYFNKKGEDVEIISNYYTIENNIENKSSSVFINEKPTSEDYINFSTKLPSYFFMIVDKGNVLGLAMLIPKTEDDSFFYNVVIPSKDLSFQIPSQLKGKITEHRANEILNLKNSKAEISKNVLKFNNMDFEVLQYDKIIAELKKNV